jgi:hypothetical protein
MAGGERYRDLAAGRVAGDERPAHAEPVERERDA